MSDTTPLRPPPAFPPPGHSGPPPARPRGVPWWRRSWMVGLVAGLVGLGIGIPVGIAFGKDSDGQSTASDRPGAFNPGTDGPEVVPEDEEVIEEPEIAPTLRPRDFQIAVKVRSKECFGYGVGCNVTVQIDPSYFGAEDITGYAYDITYELLGGENGPTVNTFQLQSDGTASFAAEEFLSTPSESTEVTAVVTSVSEQ